MTHKGNQKGKPQVKWAKQEPERATFSKENPGHFIEKVQEATKGSYGEEAKVDSAGKEVVPTVDDNSVAATPAGGPAETDDIMTPGGPDTTPGAPDTTPGE